MASAYTIAGPVGSFAAGIAMEIWGRRRISFVGNAGMVIGWGCICGAQDAALLIAGRTIEGFSRSMLASGLTVLIDELADPKFRGFTLCSIMTFASLGVVVITGLGAICDWRVASGIAGAVCLSSVFPFFFICESPSWLVRKGRIEEAAKGLTWLWGQNKEKQATQELDILKSRHGAEDQEHIKVFRITDLLKNSKQFFKARIIKPFLILHFFNTIQVFCGFSIFTFYTIDILRRIKQNNSVDSWNEDISAIIIYLVRVLGNILVTIVIIRVGRRPITLISGVGSSITAITMGVLLYLLTTEALSSHSFVVSWVNLVLIILFVGFSAFGYHILPVLMLGETQAAHVRGFVCGYIYTVNDLILGAVTKSYPSLVSSLDIHGLFLLFGSACLLCTIFIFLFLPETQGKTLEEIEDYFKQPNVMWITRKRNNTLKGS